MLQAWMTFGEIMKSQELAALAFNDVENGETGFVVYDNIPHNSDANHCSGCSSAVYESLVPCQYHWFSHINRVMSSRTPAIANKK